MEGNRFQKRHQQIVKRNLKDELKDHCESKKRGVDHRQQVRRRRQQRRREKVRRRRKRKRRSAADALMLEFQLFLLQEESSLGRGMRMLLLGTRVRARAWTRDSMCCCSEEKKRGPFLEAVAVAGVDSKESDLK